MSRGMEWQEPMGRWYCSGWAWMFDPDGPPIGQSLDEMKTHLLALRDEAFAAHVCADQTNVQTQK
jgi:hypothetical protein